MLAPTLLAPRRTHIREEGREHVAVAGGVVAPDRRDCQVRKRLALIERGDLRGIPVGDRSQIDVSDHRPGQVEVGHAGEVVAETGRRQRPGDLDTARAGCHLRGGERGVRGAEVDRLVCDVGDARSGAAAAIVHGDAVLGREVGSEHVLDERCDERGAGAREGGAGDRVGRRSDAEHAGGDRRGQRQHGDVTLDTQLASCLYAD